MKWPLRIVLVVLAIPVGFLVLGFLGGLFGVLDLPDPIADEARPVADAQTSSQPYRKPIEEDADAGSTVASATPRRIDLAPLPETLDDRSAIAWLTENALLRVKDGLIEIDASRFSSLHAGDALKLLWAFKTAQDAATGDRRNQMRLLAGYIFMGAAFLPEAERLAFAQDGQVVAWSGAGSDATRSGEFVLMFYLIGEPDQQRAEAAIQRFAPMLPASDILSALDRVGAIRVGRAAQEAWTYDLDRIAHLHPDTLQALLDFIGPWNRFDSSDDIAFEVAKSRLQELIDRRRRETGQ